VKPRRYRACAVAALLLPGWLLSSPARAVPIDLATVTCDKYENEVLTATDSAHRVDPIDTVMWLFGFSVARSGERVMYGDSLSAFGFALDGECKSNLTETLLAAVAAVKSKRVNPMDLTQLNCATYETRHVALRKSDPESADTLTMWLFGYSVGLSEHHLLDADLLRRFDLRLDEHCIQHADDTLFDALNTLQPPKEPERSRR